MTRAVTFAPLSELERVNRGMAEMAAADPNFMLSQLVQFKGSDGKPVAYVRVGVSYACKECTPALERALAKGPSWVVCELHKGPGPERPIVQRPS